MARNFVRPPRRVGNKGEAVFADWCADESISAVKSSPDTMGWDYFLEFEPEIDDSRPRDQQISLAKALVQVKATDKIRTRVPAKLSALQKLVDADMPAFIAHIAYSKMRAPIAAMLLHIGPNQIESILKKVRATEKEGRVDFNNVEFSLSLEEAKPISLPETNLGELIYSFLPEKGEHYVTAKAAHRESCGYDEKSITANFTLAPGVAGEEYVDFMLGKVPNLPIEKFEIRKKRFGIDLENDLIRGKSGILTVDIKPFQTGKVSAIDKSGRLRASMTINAYGPSIPNLPRELRKLRLANDFFEYTHNVTSRRGHMRLQIDPTKGFEIGAISEVLKFGGIMASPGSTFEIQIADNMPSQEPFPKEAVKFGNWQLLHEYVEVFASAAFRHRRGNIYDTNWQDITKGLDGYSNMLAALTRPGASVTVRKHEKPLDGFPERSAFFIPIYMQLSGLTYTAIVRCEATARRAKNDSIVFTAGKPEIVEDELYEDESASIENLNERVTEFASREGKPTIWVLSVRWRLKDLIADAPPA